MQKIDFTKIRRDVADVLTGLSLVGSTLVLLIMLVIAYFRPHYTKRVTLRLQAGVSLADLIIAIVNFRYTASSSTLACATNGFFRTAGQLVYCTLNLCIAINLQLVFLHNLSAKARWERAYWAGSIALSLLLVVPMAGLGYFGFDGQGCFISKTVKKDDPLKAFLVTHSVLITILYCTLIAGLVVGKLVMRLGDVNSVRRDHQDDAVRSRSELQAFIRKLIIRVSLYPICCTICYSGQAALFLARAFDYQNEFLYNWSILGLTLGGLVNFIAFLMDPTLQLAVRETLNHLINHRLPTKTTCHGLASINGLELDETSQGQKPSLSSHYSSHETGSMTSERLVHETSYL